MSPRRLAHVSEQTLLERVAHGDTGALQEIVWRRAGAVLAAAAEITGDPDVAEAVAEQVFADLWQAPDPARAAPSLRTYLIARAGEIAAEHRPPPRHTGLGLGLSDAERETLGTALRVGSCAELARALEQPEPVVRGWLRSGVLKLYEDSGRLA